MVPRQTAHLTITPQTLQSAITSDAEAEQFVIQGLVCLEK